MEAVECGAAALGSILGYYGRVAPLEELRVKCGVSRDGVTAKNIIRAARAYGLEAKGYKRDLEDLRKTSLPAIIFWNFNHFLVLEGIEDDTVYLNDPAVGPRTVSWEELDQAYTGIVLTFEPGPEFEKGGEEPSLFAALGSRLEGSEKAVAFAVIAGLALVVPGLLVPTFARIFVDKYLVARLDSWVKPLLVGMALTAAFRGGLTWLRAHYLLRLETKLAVSNAGRFFWHVLRLPVEFYTQRYAGEIGNRVALNDRVARLLSGRLASTAIDLMMIVFFALLMFLYDWVLTLVGIVMVGANFVVMKVVSQQRVDGNRRLLQEEGKFHGSLMSGLGNIETLKATSRESDFFTTLAGYQAKVVNAAQDLQVKTQMLLTVPPLLTGLIQATVLGLGGYRVMQGALTMGMLVAFQTLMSSFIAPVNRMIELGSKLQEMEGNMNRLDDVLRYEPDPQVTVTSPEELAGSGNGNGRARKLSGSVELRDLTFGYSKLAPPLIEGFNLRLEPGARVALVGPSGCGKSTISKLVCRLYEPWEGEILFDGTPVSEIPRAVFTSSIAFVDQDLVLFRGTIRENLTMWDETITDDDVVQAAKDALIHEAVTERREGYDSHLEEGGRNFSGGQRQRLDIARALAGNPRILVLDEATSALDTVSEERIDQNLRRRGCTCLIVAHRLSTIRDCDEIIVLKQGEVMQRGVHTDLIRDSEGLYARLIET